MPTEIGISDWREVQKTLPDDGFVVETKIDDAAGCRNETTLKEAR